MVPQADATAAAWVPAKREEFGLQEESVFSKFSEHSVCEHSQNHVGTITLLLSANHAGDLCPKKAKSSPLWTALAGCFWRRVTSRWLWADWDATLGEVRFHFPDTVGSEMSDGGDQDGIGMALGDGLVEVLQGAGAAGGNDR